MSTRATILLTEDAHLYEEMLDGTVHLEIHKPGMAINIVVMTTQEWLARAVHTTVEKELYSEITRLQNILSGDPNGTATKEDREAWRLSSVRYSKKLEDVLLEIIKEYDGCGNQQFEQPVLIDQARDVLKICKECHSYQVGIHSIHCPNHKHIGQP